MASASGLGEGRPTRSGARHGSPNNKENLVKKCRFLRENADKILLKKALISAKKRPINI